jgi:hypothetical protein
MSPGRTAAALLLACLLAGAAVPSRADGGWDWSAAVRASVLADEHAPAPYEKDEFPGWVRDLRRAEIIFVGSVPFSMFFTFEVYDTWRYVANSLDPSYAPWPFRPGSAQQYSSGEKTWLVVSSLSVSLLIAGADWVIGRVNERHARR